MMLQGFYSARSIDRNGGQQILQYLRTTAVKGRISATGEFTHLLEHRFGMRILPFLKHEDRSAQHTQLPSTVTQGVNRLLTTIPDKHHCLDWLSTGLLKRMLQHSVDLGNATQTTHAIHQFE